MNKLKLFYFSDFPNFGDGLNELIFKRIFNIQISQANRLEASAIGIGSLLQEYLTNRSSYRQRLKCEFERNFFGEVRVLGSGFIGPPGYRNLEERFRRKLKFVAVRGNLTRQRVADINGLETRNIVLGDPGLLLPMILKRETTVKKYRFGIVPHYVDASNPLIYRLANNLRHSKIINVSAAPLKVAEEISCCEIVVSTAMHGLIAADSLKIPNIWATVSDNVEGGCYKFFDYYSSLGISSVMPVDLRKSNLGESECMHVAESRRVNFQKIEEIQNTLLMVFDRELSN